MTPETEKRGEVKAILYYPGAKAGYPDRAEVEVWGHKTKTMFIVERAGPVKTLSGSKILFSVSYNKRFNIKSGYGIGKQGLWCSTWRLRSVEPIEAQ